MIESSIRVVLRERASLQPNHTAFTFLDYEQDWEGVAESLTWAQLYRRSLNLALELKGCGSTGDRAVILAPQGLDYIVAFLGALEAGLIAVPLSVPMVAIHDERVTAVLRDASPSVILTTSAVVENVVPYARPSADNPAPSVIEVDSLDLDSRKGSSARRYSRPDIAYLQYTSGSTRTPAGVVVSNSNLSANWEQIVSGYSSRLPDAKFRCVVAAVLSRHGIDVGSMRRNSGWMANSDHESDIVPPATCPVDAIAGTQSAGIVGGPEFRFRTRGRTNVRRRYGRA